MSHHLESLSPLFVSPLIRSNSNMLTTNSSVVKNLQALFDQQSSLPLVQRSSHRDLKRISSLTLVSLLNKQKNYLLIIDARYPFEYSGGHISAAINVYTENDLRLLFTKLISSTCRPSIIVFHCEFSSERGPRLCRLFRSLDRQYNIASYPYLSFPSIYLLDGGYAEFFQHSFCKEYCVPQSYISMFEQQYTQELKIYRHAKKLAHGRIITKKLIENSGPIHLCLS
ncbi:unnamed protein product [Rotaria magnacalcarata]|uniref:protein-tyrosine-phosphatase n=1 Tax=Rotaria magnacalcarata TaxID=392030 RepID=A0A815CJ08_9BILA|nr:unnamed protein product [Rotaria magnacalcarata]CAF1616029.1 unnamed protein product [Rotaria magnacalcarata]CAF2059231.1 unnamed protein product [Rotaria magnacalcarata]CAF2135869.1 unnamed protein product [Rotaria magnacalcarata]CAF2158604.1 unnamed protein product [Rotaria magnacalcarata]